MTAKGAAVIAGTDPQSPWSSPQWRQRGLPLTVWELLSNERCIQKDLLANKMVCKLWRKNVENGKW